MEEVLQFNIGVQYPVDSRWWILRIVWKFRFALKSPFKVFQGKTGFKNPLMDAIIVLLIPCIRRYYILAIWGCATQMGYFFTKNP